MLALWRPGNVFVLPILTAGRGASLTTQLDLEKYSFLMHCIGISKSKRPLPRQESNQEGSPIRLSLSSIRKNIVPTKWAFL